MDYGADGCLDAISALNEAGISTVGAGADLSAAGSVLYKKINDKTLAIINCCEHEFSIAGDSSAGANPLNPVSQFRSILEARKNADYVMVIVHGGHEHFQLPSLRMQDTYRFFVDAGADAVGRVKFITSEMWGRLLVPSRVIHWSLNEVIQAPPCFVERG